MNYLELHFADEAPEIGSGVRRVLHVGDDERGRAILLAPESCGIGHVPHEDFVIGGRLQSGFRSLSRGARSLELEPERMLARLERNASQYGCAEPAVLEAALAHLKEEQV